MPKCRDCGFLTITDLNARKLIEAEQTYRDRAELFSQRPDQRISRHPICLLRKFDLRAEASQSEAPAQVTPVLHKDRDCNEFTGWQQGMSPQEHREMIQHQQFLEWQRSREKDDRDWRERQAEREHAWRREDQSAARLRSWAVAAWTLFAALAGWLIAIYGPKL